MKTGTARFLLAVMILMLAFPPLARAAPRPAEPAGTTSPDPMEHRFAVTAPSPPAFPDAIVHHGETSTSQRNEHNRVYRMLHQQTGPSKAPELAASQTSAPSPEQSNLSPSYKEVSPEYAGPGDTLVYMIHIVNAGDLTSAYLYDPLPWVTDFVPGSEWASSGDVWFNPTEGAIEWQGDVLGGGEVQVSFKVTLSYLAAAGQPIVNTAYIYDYSTGDWFDRPGTSIGLSPFSGYDNSGKTAVDSCYAWECDWFECADPCEEMY